MGEAVTLAPVVLLRPAEGAQVYPMAPLANRLAEAPWQIVLLFTVIVGLALTVTVAVAVAVTPPEVLVTVYTVVEGGLAVTLPPEAELSPVAGLQV